MSGLLVIENPVSTRCLSFVFNGTSFPIHHICDAKEPALRQETERLGFALYTDRNRDSWTNELVLIVTDPAKAPAEIRSLSTDEISVYASRAFKPKVSPDLTVTRGTVKSLQQLKKFYRF